MAPLLCFFSALLLLVDVEAEEVEEVEEEAEAGGAAEEGEVELD
jgi:hypothetical protein